MILAVEEVLISAFKKDFRLNKKHFTPGEIKENLKRAKPFEALAARLALKQAIAKVFLKAGIPLEALCDIRITKSEKGGPAFTLRKKMLHSVYKKSQLHCYVSLAHTHERGVGIAAIQ